MTRALTISTKNRLLESPTIPVILWEGQFPAGFIRLWNGVGDLTFGSNVFNGNGWLERVDGGAEMDDVSAQSMNITLTGMPPEILSVVLNAQQGYSGKLWVGALAESGALVADPYLMFVGKLDVPTIDESSTYPRVTITYESRLVDFDRAREYRFTNDSQKSFYPTDRGFEYVRKAAKWDGFWGQTQRQVDKRRAARRKKQMKQNRR